MRSYQKVNHVDKQTLLRLNSVLGPFTTADASKRVSPVGVNTYACLSLGTCIIEVTISADLNTQRIDTIDVDVPVMTKCHPYAPFAETGQSPC
ncbi:unnamed protein product [Rotaria magnacalcarata]|uniref:Uncharacterized protein n=1 Tax=Rotaria magnacalcarata TaxID=392030 RepID=A0A8S2P2H5_9BILA|nr:unnamed protein product [Rotaria magnacalcarata]